MHTSGNSRRALSKSAAVEPSGRYNSIASSSPSHAFHAGIGAIELVRDRATKESPPWEEQRGAQVCRLARKAGVMVRPLGNIIVLMPPLAITLEELDRILLAVEQGIEEAFS
jgi:hypothetical protein